MTAFTKEQALQALTSFPENPSRSLFEAIIHDTLPQYFYKEMFSLRYDYSDELPNTDVRFLIDLSAQLSNGHYQTLCYKCQTNYLRAFVRTLTNVLEYQLINDPEITAAVTTFIEDPNNLQGFEIGHPANANRIVSMNQVLDQVIGGFQNQYGSILPQENAL